MISKQEAIKQIEDKISEYKENKKMYRAFGMVNMVKIFDLKITQL